MANERRRSEGRAVFRLLPVLLVLLLGGLIPSGLGCAAPPAPAGGGSLLQGRFPAHAARVLQGHEAFVANARGFTTGAGQGRGGLSLVLPADAEDELRFQLPGGFEARVREVGASGPGAVVERAVSYARAGGTSYWTATEQGYEEWLLLGAGQATGDAPVAAWEVDGATLEQVGDAVSVRDARGAERLRVTAPAAYRLDGEPAIARLAVREGRIELSVDAGGEPVLVDPLWATPGLMGTGRYGHTATLLADGTVLVVGGANGALLSSAEIYSPSTNAWSGTGAMSGPRTAHTATLLADGRVLVVGGLGGAPLASAEIYDPSTHGWSPASPMSTPRYSHTATLLADGRVLVVGGVSLATAEIYDPVHDTWSSAGSSSADRNGHTATLLSNNKVLVAGGCSGSGCAGGYLASADLYDPSSGTWAPAAAMGTPRYTHSATLVGTSVLVAGGSDNGTFLATGELYDPTTDHWTPAGAMGTARRAHTATLLANGKVLMAGGINSDYVASADVYDPSNGLWLSAGSMSVPRYLGTATLLSSGRVLVAGGGNLSGYAASADVYDPTLHVWLTPASMSAARFAHTATLLTSGKVLVAGGNGFNGSPISSTELFTPSTNTWSTVGSMSQPRAYHTATRLTNGKVLVAGGITNNAIVADAELYDPSTNTWSPAHPMNVARMWHTATLLTNGKVLVAGGGEPATNTAEVYDPATDTWNATGTMTATRTAHTATLLTSGSRVLVAGGDAVSTYHVPPHPVWTAEIYNPATNTWLATGSMSYSREGAAAALVGSKVLVAGGAGAGGSLLASAEMYNPGTGAWLPVNSMLTKRFASATVLASGQVLVAGGIVEIAGVQTTASSAELYTPGTGLWTSAGAMTTPRWQPTATLLGNGSVLVVGGANWDIGGDAHTSAEYYVP